ncbi:MAG: AAA family ATPase, partial [Clostridium celatum]|nr:AAA family ATPase [Clostridium celatum]
EMENNKEKNSEDTLVNLYEPNWSLDEVYISNEDKETILTSLSMAKYKDILFNKWGIKGNKDNGRALCLNFWGAPGTGKSITAEAIANNLEKKLLIVNYSELESKYVGETPKNIKRIFKIAKENDAVIVFDEADSFLGKRLTNVTQSADYGVNITRSVMLIELENFDGVVIFTTNLLTNYDDAFKRRILANIEFKLPDENGRKRIWETHIPKSMPISDDVSIDILSKRFSNISGADIKDIVLFAATKSLRDGREVVNIQDFEYGNNVVIKRYENQKLNDDVKIKTERITEEQYLEEIKASNSKS